MFVRKILRIVCESFEGEISKNLKNHTCSALIYVIPINKKKVHKYHMNGRQTIEIVVFLWAQPENRITI